MVESAPTAQSQQLLQALDLDQELTLCKQYLEESQEEVQQLQAQLAGSRQAASAAASKATKLQQQLHDSQQQLHDSQRLNEQLQQELASKAEAAELQLAAARQQLTDAKQALIAMQAAMRDLQLHQQQQAQHGQAQADQAADKLALVKGQATAGLLNKQWSGDTYWHGVMVLCTCAAQTLQPPCRIPCCIALPQILLQQIGVAMYQLHGLISHRSMQPPGTTLSLHYTIQVHLTTPYVCTYSASLISILPSRIFSAFGSQSGAEASAGSSRAAGGCAGSRAISAAGL